MRLLPPLRRLLLLLLLLLLLRRLLLFSQRLTCSAVSFSPLFFFSLRRCGRTTPSGELLELAEASERQLGPPKGSPSSVAGRGLSPLVARAELSVELGADEVRAEVCADAREFEGRGGSREWARAGL